MLGAITWDIDPILLHLGPLQIRYYGLCFAASIYTGFWIWQRNAHRWGHSLEFSEDFLWYAVIAIVGGARLGHCLFYEPERYLSNPIEILYFWKGGLASHGATVGLFIAVYLFAKRKGVTFRRVGDMMTPAIALAAGGVRIGNFFNSEIVGRPWDGPWAVIFARHDRMLQIPSVPRHPTAFYEVLMGIITFSVLWLLAKKDVRRAGSGLTTGVFLVVYFTFRFLVEYFKEYQVDAFIERAERLAMGADNGVQLTMGQYLSILPVLIGVLMIAMAMRMPKDAIADPLLQPMATPDAGAMASSPESGAGRRSGKKGGKRR
jgi:phosphatidylglycerol:prolipoprotein diacylglycerol transferase